MDLQKFLYLKSFGYSVPLEEGRSSFVVKYFERNDSNIFIEQLRSKVVGWPARPQNDKF